MDQLQGAIAAGFIVACVGALFLAEQYYPPLWFLPALAASMATSLPGPGPGWTLAVRSGRVQVGAPLARAGP